MSGERDGIVDSIVDLFKRDVEDKIKRFKDDLNRATFLDSVDPRRENARVTVLIEETLAQFGSNHRQVRVESQTAPSTAIDRGAEASSSGSGGDGLPDGHVNISGLDKVKSVRAFWEKQVIADDYAKRAAPFPELTDAKIQRALEEEGGYIYFLCGKFLETDFSGDVINSEAYNARAGANVMEAVVRELREASTAPSIYHAVKAIDERRLKEVRTNKKIEGDGACYWRAVLDGIPNKVRRLLDLPVDIDFANGCRDDVFPIVDKIRVMTAEFVEQASAKNTVEWREIQGCVTGIYANGDLDAWLLNMRTPLKDLVIGVRYADEMVLAVTPRLFHKLGVDLGVEIVKRITTDESGQVISDESALLVHRVGVHLAYHLHENGIGFHFERVVTNDDRVPQRMRSL
jgi:hypothetical protein